MRTAAIWIATAVAVSVALYITKDARCLLALIIPAAVTYKA
jgi:hypothetical protein